MIKKPSVFRGDIWLAFRPGEDARFKDAWVSRDRYENLCAVVNTRKALMENAKLNEVTLRWKRLAAYVCSCGHVNNLKRRKPNPATP